MSYVLNEEQVRRVLESDGYPITKAIVRDRDGVRYSVVCGGEGGSDFENARGVWDRFVEFSSTVKRTGAKGFQGVRWHDDAGGPAFVAAAREQEAVAAAVLALLQERGR